MNCPHCNTELETFSKAEGGYCPECKDWYPYDIILDLQEDDDE